MKLGALAILASGLGGAAQAACSLALALGLDVSASVDEAEYRLQLDGLAAALRAPDVQRQILSNAETPIWLTAFEWAGADHQRSLLGWRPLSTARDIEAVARQLEATRRQRSTSSTAIGAAMRHASGLFERGPGCWRRTLDLSGDGTNNDGPLPNYVTRAAAYRGVTVNGLVIGADVSKGRDERQMELMELSAYYRRRVIHGPGAFIEVAQGFEDYERAMTRKLLRETRALQLGAVDLVPRPAR